MEPRAGWAGNRFIGSRLILPLLVQQGLHVHARLRAPEYDEVGHRA
jgi:hypothetical protein